MQNITVGQFRARFVEFRDTTAYPDPTIELYISDSAAEVDFDKFDLRGPKAQALWVAHQLILADRRTAQDLGGNGAGGSAPGGGPVQLLASQSEGDTSESYVTSAMASSDDPAEAFWNTTAYGQEYWAMAKYAVPNVTSTGSVQFPNPRLRWPGPFSGR